MVKRVALAVLLLAVVGVAACGDEQPAQPAVEVPAWAMVAPEQIAEARKHGVPVAFENDLGMRFVLIPAGTFLMGSPKDEEGRGDDETQHQVTITKPYYVQIAEVTNEQFLRFDPKHDSGTFKGYTLRDPAQPVVSLSWPEARRLSVWLSERDADREYRLPTEAEWEQACRAGTTGRFSWGESDGDAYRHANANDPVSNASINGHPRRGMFSRDDGQRVSAPVGTFLPNAWGLYDMLGNVWEWCEDAHEGLQDYAQPTLYDVEVDGPDPTHADAARLRIMRGGSWRDAPENVRPARRCACDLSYGGNNESGVRLVSPLPERGQ